MRIIVAGAGIGGLTAALALNRAGFAVQVLEQAPALGEVGAGIQVSPNAVKVLWALGLAEPLERVAVRPQALEGHDHRTGALKYTVALGDAVVAAHGAPYYHIYRPDLLQVLSDAATADGLDIRFDARVADVAQDEAGVTVRLESGDEVAGELLVGADGINSRVKQALFGPHPPRFTGNVAFRGTVPVERLPDGLIERKGYNWMGPHHHFVHYFVNGGRLVNCVGVCEQPDWRIESWVHPGDLEEFRQEFSGWHDTIQTLIGAMSHCFKWALFDRDPLDRWSVGRATLLGDSAHPMLPFLAQGACMAIEDGYALTRCLQRHDDPLAALADYEERRRPRTAQMQLGARARATQLHAADPELIRQRNEAVADDPDYMAKVMQAAYAYDAIADLGAIANT
ncbi:MAG: FAD-dependent monooxygenase [Alphaproteobacteria bacterium]